VDLAKINIEGGYPLLQRMIETGVIPRWHDLQTSFTAVPTPNSGTHPCRLVPDARATYDYPFVWENWRRSADR
jgi:hypothetical protein